MEKKLKYFQRENEILKERAQNVEILREDNNTLRAAIESKDRILSDYHRMKVRSINYAFQLKKWIARLIFETFSKRLIVP